MDIILSTKILEAFVAYKKELTEGASIAGPRLTELITREAALGGYATNCSGPQSVESHYVSSH